LRKGDPVVSEAKRYFKTRVYRWRTRQRKFYKDIHEIEEPTLRLAVSLTAKAILDGRAAFFVQGQKGHNTRLWISFIDVDEDVCDQIEDVLSLLGVADPEERHDQAGQWLIGSLTGCSMAFLAWAFAHLDFEVGAKFNITCDRVVFNAEQKKILGVLTKQGSNVIVPSSLLKNVAGHRGYPKWLTQVEVTKKGDRLTDENRK
jgi:hypothetical protein